MDRHLTYTLPKTVARKYAILWVDKKGRSGRLPRLYKEIDAWRKVNQLNRGDKRGRRYRLFPVDQAAGSFLGGYWWIPALIAVGALKYLGLVDKYWGMLKLP